MTEYKNTFIGRIPVSWKLEKLKNLSTKITDGTHKTPKYIEKGIPFLRVTDIKFKNIKWNNTKHVSKEEHDDMCKRCNPKKNDILYSKNGTIGIPKIIDWDTEFSIFVSLCLIKPKHDLIYNKFLEQYLKSMSCKKQIDLRAKQGAVTNLHLEEIKEIEIPLPALPEQKKIAKILSTVDNHIDEVDGMIEDLKELKKGLMQKLLTEGIGHTEFKDSSVGRIPVEWEVKRLSEVSKIVPGGTPSSDKESYWNGNVLWATPTDITSNGKYIESTERTITVEGLKNSSANLLKKNSILMTSRATIAECSINLKEMATNQGFKSFEVNENIDVNFMYYIIIFNKQKFVKLSSGSTFLEISKKEVENIQIQIPSYYEQKKIGDIISSIDNRIEKFEIKIGDMREIKRGLMQQLLTGKTRVKIDE